MKLIASSLFWHSIMSLEWIKARASVAHHSRRDDGATPEVRGGRLPLLLLLLEQVRQARLPQTSRHLAPQHLGHKRSSAKKHNTIARWARIRKWQALGSDSQKRKCGKWNWGVQFEPWWGQRTKRQWYKGTTQQWYKGTTQQWYKGTTVRWYNEVQLWGKTSCHSWQNEDQLRGKASCRSWQVGDPQNSTKKFAKYEPKRAEKSQT